MFSSIVNVSYSRKDLKPIENKIIEQKSCTQNEFYRGLAELFYHLIQASNSEVLINGELETERKSML